MGCADLHSYLEAFVDDELSAERTLEIQSHLRHCASCSAEVELSRAVVRTTRKAQEQVCLCPDFEARLRGTLAAECKKLDESEHGHPLTWRTIVPLTAAAAAVLSLGFVASQKSALFKQSAGPSQPQLAQVSAGDNLVDFLVQHHTRGSGPQFRDESAVDRMEPELGFPVHPPNLDQYGARFVGANLVHSNRGNVASLHYVLGSRRFTLYVYNPIQMPVRAIPVLRPTVVGNDAVFVGTHLGYSLAACEKEGLGYAVAADLSDEESAELVAGVKRWSAAPRSRLASASAQPGP